MKTPRETAFSRRAALRKSTAEQTPLPETTGDTGKADMASLVFTGVPEGEFASTGEQLATVMGEHARQLARLRPQIPSTAWEKFVKLLVGGTAVLK